MGVGEALSPVRKTQLSTAAEASEMQARRGMDPPLLPSASKDKLDSQ